MVKNYFTTALRNLWRRKGYSFINITGLAVGIACCLIIFQYIAFEYSFDSFNTKADNLYRLTQIRLQSGREPESGALGGYALGPALAERVPEIVRFARLHPDFGGAIIANVAKPDEAFDEQRVYYADAEFLEMFSYPLVQGESAKALVEPGTVLISASTAQKYFGTENPVGQTLKVTGWISGIYRISGVFADVPANSHLQFDVLLPMADLLAKSAYNDPARGWDWQNFFTYVQLREQANLAGIEQKMTDVLLNFRGEDFQRANITVQLTAQPLRDIHLNEAVFAPKAVQGSYRTVYFFAIIALITLAIALVNYVNLATARSLDRSREVGVRKVVGAQRRQLIFQFLFESALTNLVAMALAIVLAETLRPLVNTLAGSQLEYGLGADPWLWAGFFAAFCTGTLLAGLYPAFVLSSFRPIAVLRGKYSSIFRRLRLRQSLVVLQFAASIGLLAGAAVVYSQLDYMQRMDLGLNLEQILTVPGPRVLAEGVDETQANTSLANELRQIPSVLKITTSSALPGQGFNWYSSNLRRESADPSTAVNGALAWVDTSFASFYGLELIAGSGFEGISINTPEGQPRPVIANETAIKAVGFDTPAEAVHQLLGMGGSTFRVVGVFKDFNWSSAHEQREAALFTPTPAGRHFSMKVMTENLPQTIATIERTYKTLFPGNPFDYGFADEEFEKQYLNDRRFAALFSMFAALAISIACLGLFGLVSLSMQQRVKEVSIRKILGASVSGITAHLSSEFLRLVMLANLFAWPLAYYLMNGWLENFAYRIGISWWVFALAGGLALLIALLTVSTQAVRAALANPVKSLRYE